MKTKKILLLGALAGGLLYAADPETVEDTLADTLSALDLLFLLDLLPERAKAKAKAKAKREHTTVSAIVVKALFDWVGDN